MRKLNCREHGGTFTVESKRGRPPVRCTEDNPCSKLTGDRPVRPHPENPSAARGTRVVKSRAAETASVIKNRRNAEAIEAAKRKAVMPKELQTPAKAPQRVAEPTTTVMPSVLKAQAAKELLEPQGWVCHAKIATPTTVEFHASRGSERLALVWENGEPVSQDYSLFDMERPSANGVPAGKVKLPFDPDEMTDSELVRHLSGMTVVWWNRIAKGEEKATLPARVQVVHTYNGTGDETPADRVITFVDVHGSGFRSFRVGALMRIGK